VVKLADHLICFHKDYYEEEHGLSALSGS